MDNRAVLLTGDQEAYSADYMLDLAPELLERIVAIVIDRCHTENYFSRQRVPNPSNFSEFRRPSAIGTRIVPMDGTVIVPVTEELTVPALNVEFSDDELATVRAAAGNAGTSMRAFAKQAILDRAIDREGRVRALGIEIAQRSSELNNRLA